MLTGIQDGKKVPYHLGHFFIAIDTEAFMGLEEFKKTAGDILRSLRASQKAPGSDRIYTAEKRNTWSGLSAKTKAFPSTKPCKKK